MPSARSVRPFLNAALLTETICVSYGLLIPAAQSLVSILYLLAGCAIALLFLFNNDHHPATADRKALRRLLVPLVAVSMFFFGRRILAAEPLSYLSADMLPVIKTMCERFLVGHWSQVYNPIPEIWQGIQPVYLPAMWLPYSIPVAMGIDVRWLTIASLFLVYGLLLRKMRFAKQQWPLMVGALLLLCWLLTSDACGLIPFSEEGLVILYYTLLVIAVQRRNPWLIGLTAALCLLSRYALIGWIPAMLLYYSWRKEWKTLLQISLAGTATSLLLILPFGWKNFQSLLALPTSYIEFSGRVWHDSPEVFTESIGLARFFGPENIAWQHRLLILLSFTLPSISMLLLLKFERKFAISGERIPLAILKLTLLVFYSMVDVPYLYLFYTASFVSLFMLLDGKRRVPTAL